LRASNCSRGSARGSFSINTHTNTTVSLPPRLSLFCCHPGYHCLTVTMVSYFGYFFTTVSPPSHSHHGLELAATVTAVAQLAATVTAVTLPPWSRTCGHCYRCRIATMISNLRPLLPLSHCHHGFELTTTVTAVALPPRSRTSNHCYCCLSATMVSDLWPLLPLSRCHHGYHCLTATRSRTSALLPLSDCHHDLELAATVTAVALPPWSRTWLCYPCLPSMVSDLLSLY
jgi:hypothetical protein